MSFGSYIREMRIKKGLGLGDLAKMVGVSPAYLSRIERDIDPPPRSERIVALTDAMEIDCDDAYIAAGQLPYDLAGDIRNVVLYYRNLHPKDGGFPIG